MTSGKRDRSAPREIRWSDRAKNGLASIGDFIADDSPAAAARWVGQLIGDVERAAVMPLAGRIVAEYADRGDIREVLRRRYRIVYRVRGEAIEVLTIFESHRLFPRTAGPSDCNGDG
ncbi:MAG: plasmid stabilization protein [Deltaproteobacteria bacterium]|nr:MAG: plasmid stabilization protein [Deltaproteobacteria bacterium]